MSPASRHPLRALTRFTLAIAAAALLVSPVAIASPQSKVAPTVTCVEVNGDGSVTAHWGYVNTWGSQVTVQVGNKTSGQNWLSPGAEDRGQPTSFAPGTHDDAFTVTFTSATLTWTLDDSKQSPANSATASTSSSRCAPVPALGVDSPLPLALAAVCLGALLAARRRRALEGRPT